MAKDRTNSEPDDPVSNDGVSSDGVNRSSANHASESDQTSSQPKGDAGNGDVVNGDVAHGKSVTSDPKAARIARLAAIKADVDAGKYDSDEMLELALNKMIQRLPTDRDNE